MPQTSFNIVDCTRYDSTFPYFERGARQERTKTYVNAGRAETVKLRAIDSVDGERGILDTPRNDFVPDTDSSLDRELSDRETFLLEEGLELLARYRKIGDPQMRLVIRQLVDRIAEGQTREQ